MLRSSSAAFSASTRRLPYAPVACDLCRRRKRRCDWVNRHDGRCTQCVAADQSCIKQSLSRCPQAQSDASNLDIDPLMRANSRVDHIHSSMSQTTDTLSQSTAVRTGDNEQKICVLNSNLEIHLDETVEFYVSSYFNTFNRGGYFYIDYIEEDAFLAQYRFMVAHVDRVDMSWTLCISAVLAISARMNGHFQYAEYAATVASRTVFLLAAQSHRHEFMREWSNHRLAKAYRALLALCYYMSATDNPQLPMYIHFARELVTDKEVADILPVNLAQTAHFLPRLRQSFGHISIKEWSTSGTSDSNGLQIPAYLEENIESRWDNRYECSDEAKKRLYQQLSETNYYLSYLMTFGYGLPLTNHVYYALSVLSKAESYIRGHQRISIFSRKAVFYQLLGERMLAIQSARQALQCFSDVEFAASTEHPPFPLHFIRSVMILAEWDDGDEDVISSLILAALRVFQRVAALWPGRFTIMSKLLSHLQSAINDRESRALASVDDSRRWLEYEVFNNAWHQDTEESLRLAAQQLVHNDRQLERIRRMRHLLNV